MGRPSLGILAAVEGAGLTPFCTSLRALPGGVAMLVELEACADRIVATSSKLWSMVANGPTSSITVQALTPEYCLSSTHCLPSLRQDHDERIGLGHDQLTQHDDGRRELAKTGPYRRLPSLWPTNDPGQLRPTRSLRMLSSIIQAFKRSQVKSSCNAHR